MCAESTRLRSFITVLQWFSSLGDSRRLHLLLHLAQLLQDLLCVLRLGTVVHRQMGRQSLQRSCIPHRMSGPTEPQQGDSAAQSIGHKQGNKGRTCNHAGTNKIERAGACWMVQQPSKREEDK